MSYVICLKVLIKFFWSISFFLLYCFCLHPEFIVTDDTKVRLRKMETLIENALNEFTQNVKMVLANLANYLLDGELHKVEDELHALITNLYNQLILIIIIEVANTPEMKEKAKIIGQKKGLGKIRKTTVRLQLRTGKIFAIPSFYASRSKPKRRCKRGPNGTGCHLLLAYWGCIDKTTPGYYSYAVQLCILCPSFEIATQILNDQGIDADYKRIRRLSYRVAGEAMSDRIHNILKPGEHVKGKRVLIAPDGGRTRTRVYKEKGENNKRDPFDTPWREPKLFVIHILNEDGSMSRKELPIYDACIGHAGQCFDLLAQYLKALHIEAAAEVLFIADGAEWIWNRAQKMLLSLGVAREKIVEAIDYYHASEHLWQVISDKLAHLTKKKQKALYKWLKDELWNGNIKTICQEIIRLGNDRDYVTRGLAYFQDAPSRFQYNKLRQKNLPCGSGIVESAIRRVINLRFKSPSTFWGKENVEGLIYLRAAFLAGRWKILMTNLTAKFQFSKSKTN